jgi:hypothetical protein
MSLRSKAAKRLLTVSGLSGLFLLLPWDFINLDQYLDVNPARRNNEGQPSPCQLELPLIAPKPGLYRSFERLKGESLDDAGTVEGPVS